MGGVPAQLGDPAPEQRRLARRQHREPGTRLRVPRHRPGELQRLLRLAGLPRRRRDRHVTRVPRCAVVHLPRPDQCVRRDARRSRQLAGQRDRRRRHRPGDDPGLHQAGVRGARMRRGLSLLGRGRAQLRAPPGRHRGPDRRAVGMGTSDGRAALVPAGGRRLPAVGEVAARRGQSDGRRPAGDLARSHLHPVEPCGDPRLHLDRRAPDPGRRRLGHRPTRAWSSTRSTRTRPTRPASSTRRSASPAWSSRSRSTTPTAVR